ncbi:protein translocase subunit SecD [Pseudoalteromonas sp. MMG024]|uniref:protein translocase subunit SecD n=1 Tax=Pseudoalteromonas sp. MMG024 TaxID=2909980 RepID=UPI0031BA77D6|nr:protein translocase subunit SecD [Pseudoalteromonas sp. MMG024]
MINKYPLWKYLMVVAVVLLGMLYAAPNMYGSDPAVQISGARGAVIETADLDKVKTILTNDGFDAKSIKLENEQILIRFNDVETQLKAKDQLSDSLGANYIAAINSAPSTPAWLENLGGAPMKLGLDLRGGVEFTMEVDMRTAINNQLKQMQQDFRSDLREQKIRYRSIREVANADRVQLVFRNEEDKDAAESYLQKSNPSLEFRDDRSNELAFTARLTEAKLKEIRDYAISQNLIIIRKRINQIGVAEPNVQRQGQERILVQLPGIQDPARAKEILGSAATLELRMVDQDNDVRDALAGRMPPGSEVINDQFGRPVLLKKRVMLEGSHITGAQAGYDQYQRPQVSLQLDSKGGSKMAAFTKDEVGNLMAIVFIEYRPSGKVDENGKALPPIKHEEVINQATINERLGRRFQITGIDTPAKAQHLSEMLRAGALVAPIQIVAESTIGPSMGAENVEKGITAVVLGFVFVLVFMLLYYKGFGLIANIALGLNLVLIVGAMSVLAGATLTLPGIAGIVLTVGMAVDANVLIFERIREELAEGRSPQQAIHHGYDSAFSTIFDANITTLIAAVILYAIGTGPIQGFAITLAIGIVTSMFTAIVGTRAIVNALIGGKRIEKLSI